jgi:hypothetical protein
MLRSSALCGALLASVCLTTAGCSSPTEDDEVGSSDSRVTLTSNESSAYKFFVTKGLTAAQSAGIVGNLVQESSVSPTIRQPDGPGIGIAQWSRGDRWDSASRDNAVWFANSHGENVWSLETQLEFIWYELTTFPQWGLANLRGAGSVDAATVAFMRDFERCGACNSSNRIAQAKRVLSQAGGGGAAGGGGNDGACSVHSSDHRLYCTNRVTPLYKTASKTSSVVDTLRSTSSWFTCWTEGDLHEGGNRTWYSTQGDDHGNWGFAPAVALDTPDNFDTTALAHGLPHCDH